jgi:hypothetical protein
MLGKAAWAAFGVDAEYGSRRVAAGSIGPPQ